MDDIDASDCCGNGCANCVLDIKQRKSNKTDKNGKQNILEKYTKFLLINKTLHLEQTANVWELHFKSKHHDNKDFILDMSPGYHLMMRKNLTDTNKTQNKENDVDMERKYLLRPYSPFWWDTVQMEFKILINILPNGPMSEYIKNLEINDEVEFRGPIGTFEYHLDEKGVKCMLMISQGIAIAPVIPIIEEILNNEHDMTRIVHIACFQDLQHMYFRDKLYNFSQYWNYKTHIYLSKELCNDIDCINNSQCLAKCENLKNKLKYKEIIIPHRLVNNDFKRILDKLEQTKENTFVTISGTGTFQTYFKQLCQATDYGLLKNNIYLL